MESNPEIQILSGPSREELFDGLRLFSEGRNTFFTIKNDEGSVTLPTTIHAIQAEDGTGSKWNIEFHILVKDMNTLSFFQEINSTESLRKYSVRFKGFYSTQTRKGTMTAQ